MRAVDGQSRQGGYRLPTGRAALGIAPFLSNLHPVEKMIEPEGLVIDPELVAIIGVKAAHLLKLPKRSLDVENNADFLGPFALCCLIERFTLFDAAAVKFQNLGRTGLGLKHDRGVAEGDCQGKYAAARLDDRLSI